MVRFTTDYRNDDRISTVDRAAAEEFSRKLAVDNSTASELPSEDWIEWFFSWEGNPPDQDDFSWEDDHHVQQWKADRTSQQDR
ncbi:hypothetical protein [Nocardia sp. GTS18]|uniref:hypothetical protein n=1 Tax=Nocardia sp. GTS18 TaxID=1778064 RepID=UPI0015EEDE5D|nr:hypothetical protein [Nocardia sp. GTS18]